MSNAVFTLKRKTLPTSDLSHEQIERHVAPPSGVAVADAVKQLDGRKLREMVQDLEHAR